MKKIATLVLVAMLLSFVLASCGTPTPPHEHTFASGWSADATGHWHGATCEHTTEKADFAAHTDRDGNGKCDACLYTLFTLDTITVNAPDGVTVSENLTAQTGTDLVFTASVSNKYLLIADGAEFVEKTVDGDIATYKFKVTAINEDTDVTLTKEKYVFVDEITTGEGTYTDLVSNQFVFGEITVNFDKAGTYYIYSDNGFVRFDCGVDAWGDYIYEQIYKVVVEEAGEITVATRMFAEVDAEEFAYNYYVVEADTVIVIDEAAEDYVLPSNMEVVLQYTTTEKGWYVISLESDDFEYLSYQGQTVYISEAGAIIETPVSVYAESLPEFAIGYNASWTVEKLAPTVVQAGDNNLTFKSNTNNLVSFTAPEAGVYSFVLTLDSNMFKYWSNDGYVASTFSTVYISEFLTAGETIEILISNTTEEYNAETFETTLVDCEITDTLTITNLNYVIDTEGGVTNGMVDSDGVINSIFNTSDEDVTYYVNGGEGVLIGVDDGEGNITWVSNYDFVVGANSSVSFLLKSDVEEATEVAITAKAVVYEIYTSFGSNYAEDLIPGKTYTLTTFEDLEQMNPYIFTWYNEDVSILVNGEAVESGVAFTYYTGYEFTMVNNGTEECSVSVEFVDPMSQGDLMIGENSVDVVYLNGFAQYIDMTFSVAGMYVLTPAEGEENLVVSYITDNGSEEVTLPFEFTVADGETATFAISSSLTDATEDTVNFTIENKYEGFYDAPNGKFEAKDPNGNVIYGFNFEPVEGKKYGTVEIEEFSGWYSDINTYTFALTTNNDMVLWDEDGYYTTLYFSFIVDRGGNWGIVHPEYNQPIALEAVSSGADFSDANDYIANTYWVDETNTYTLMFAFNPMIGQYVGQFHNDDYSVHIEFNFTVVGIDSYRGDYIVAISNVNAMFGDINLFSGIPAYGDGGIIVWSDLSQLDVMFQTDDGSVQYWFYPAE